MNFLFISWLVLYKRISPDNRGFVLVLAVVRKSLPETDKNVPNKERMF